MLHQGVVFTTLDLVEKSPYLFFTRRRKIFTRSDLVFSKFGVAPLRFVVFLNPKLFQNTRKGA